MSSREWAVEPAFTGTAAADEFSSLDKVFALQGEIITRDSISNVVRVSVAGKRYYVKRYSRRGNGLGQWLGRSKIQGEWANLLFFRELGLPVPAIFAYGEQGQRGALITQEVVDSIDLAELAKRDAPQLKDPAWVREVISQVADAAQKMHRERFVHNDFKWRNILIVEAEKPQIYLIDCPSGGFWWGPFLEYRIVKDLACLDKVAKYQLSFRQRLSFYREYVGRKRLGVRDKKRLEKILIFFKGRE